LVQSLIFAFLLSCRLEAAWQFAMVVVVACAIAAAVLLVPQPDKRGGRIARLARLWPAAVFALTVSAYLAAVFASADRRYALEPKNHIVWHEVLMGILSTSPQLRQQYVGDALRTYGDTEVYTAVIRDINARNDASSPIARRLPDGQLTIDLMAGSSEYDKLVRSLVLRIILDHPLAVLEAVPTKLGDQIVLFDNPVAHNMVRNLKVPIVLVVAAALACMAAGGFATDRATPRSVVAVVATVLLFAAATPLIHPSQLAVGTLFCYFGALAIALAYGATLLVRTIRCATR
jgi:hypothetical protein